jgi:hypothetical protein
VSTEGDAGRGKEAAFVAAREKTIDEARDLPLPAAHFAPGVKVEDAHQRPGAMKRALAYFRKL